MREKNYPYVYTTQEGKGEKKFKPQLYTKGIKEIKNNPKVYPTQEGIEEIKNNPQVYTTQVGIKILKKILRYTLPKRV